ncbi:MAG: FtsX-like permease family protein, partial [Verrucomicrobiota bacterium]
TLGIAALVAIGSFRQSLAQAIDEQARTLLGSDLAIESSRPFSPVEETFLHSLGEPQAREVRFSTMAVFVREGGTRLVTLRALGGAFPFYGTMETEPATAGRDFRDGSRAVVDESLLLQFHSRVGDTIKIGDAQFTIVGILKKLPGDTSARASLAPRVYIPLQNLAETNLLKPGSVARYHAFIKFPAGTDVAQRIATLAPQIQRLGLEFDTVEKRKKNLGAALENLYRFLNLVGFISLLLGAVGVASAIQAHLQQKIRTVAILRCLGASGWNATAIYLMQAAAMGLAGAAAGGVLGVAIARIVPVVFHSSLPFAISPGIAWSPAISGMAVGFAICVLFALPSLLSVRRISPLQIFRGSDELSSATYFDFTKWIVYVLIGAGVTAFAISQTETFIQGLIFAGGLGLAILVLLGVAKLLILVVRKFFPERASFVLRQGMANLFRPNNRTLLLTISLGLGTFLLLSLFLTREVLLAQFRSLDRNEQPNIFLFDIQPDQTGAVAELMRTLHFPVIQEAPIVTMRLVEIKGRKSADLLADPKRTIPEWELEHEYRSTYREDLSNTEKITAGQWIGRMEYHPGDTVPISVEEDIAKDLGVRLGDRLVFDVQGILIRTSVGSLRKVDWKRFQTNFFVVFPAGVLENAPKFGVLVSRVSTPAESARLQNAIVAKFPNVAALDLTAVIQTVDSILSKVAIVIRVMSLFTVGAGLIVLITTIWSGRYQRMKESILLRTLGASRAQIWKILCAEYFFLGALAGATGIVLALAASWALATFVFKLTYAPSLWPLIATAGIVPALTVFIGTLTSRGIGNAPPLEILRAEAD